jgi:hypothetical protein
VETIQPSCGCIVPTYHKAPIHFDEYDDMMLTIKIKGRKGLFKKSITLNSNFGSRTIEVKGYIN